MYNKKRSDKEPEGSPNNNHHYGGILQASNKPSFTHLAGNQSGEESLEQCRMSE